MLDSLPVCRTALVGFTLLFLLKSTAFAADPTGSRKDTFVDSIDVRVINVEVVVTDASGQRVSGLLAEDFDLRVDGETVSIGYFSEIREGRVSAAPPTRSRPVDADDPPPREVQKTSIAATAPRTMAPPGEALATNYLVYVDDYFAWPKHRNLVLDKIRDDLEQLSPGDQVAVVAFDGRRLDLLLDWSTSTADVATAFDVARKRHARLAERETKILSGHALGVKHADQLRRTFTSVATAMRGLASPPGRRVLLMLSGGWPLDLGAFYGGSFEETSDQWKIKEAFSHLSNTANLTGFTIYPIDVVGLESGARPIDDDGSRPQDPESFAVGVRGRTGERPNPVPPPTSEQNAAEALSFSFSRFSEGAGREQQHEASLLTVAATTGGKALINSARDRALATAVEDTRSYYWLGFDWPRSGDDRYRKIEVVARRPGLEVRSRQGFIDVSRGIEVELAVESLLLVESSAGLGTSLPVVIGDPRRASRKQVEVPFSLTIPLDEIAKLPTSDGFRVVLELHIASIDADGHRSQVAKVPLDLPLSAELAAAPHVVYDAAIRVKRLDQQLVFALYDTTSGNVIAARVALTI